MNYAGGKWYEYPFIVPVLSAMRKGRPYLEPFVGIGSVLAHMDNPPGRTGYDVNRFVIAMMNAIRPQTSGQIELMGQEVLLIGAG